jgi:hypothetical protein
LVIKNNATTISDNMQVLYNFYLFTSLGTHLEAEILGHM